MVPKYIVIHTALFDGEADISDIRDWHIARGWHDVGYHWYIRRSGEVQAGRPETQIGAHCLGYNDRSLGICFEGNGDKQPLTETQIDTLCELYIDIRNRWMIPVDRVRGHRELDTNRTCPGKCISMDILRNILRVYSMPIHHEKNNDPIVRATIDPITFDELWPVMPKEWVEPVQYDEKLSNFVRKLSERAKWHRIARISFNASLSIFSRWIPELSHLKIPVDPDKPNQNEVPKMKWIQERLKEGSTWRGIAVLIAAFIISRFGLDVSPEVLLSSLEGIVTAGALLVASVAGLWDILKPEKPETPGAAPD